MDLHRAPKKAQWELIPEEEWNDYQRRAAETNGWDTPGNRESAKGLALTLAGIGAVAVRRPLIAAGLIGWGRWKDIKDGRRAEETGTKSPKGEGIDAAVDKVVMAAALPVMAARDVIQPGAAVGLGIHHGLNTVFTGIAKARGREIHPRLIGKVSTAMQWAAIGAGVLAQASDSMGRESWRDIFQSAETALMVGGLSLGAVATVQYGIDALGPNKNEQPAIPAGWLDD